MKKTLFTKEVFLVEKIPGKTEKPSENLPPFGEGTLRRQRDANGV